MITAETYHVKWRRAMGWPVTSFQGLFGDAPYNQ